LNCNWIGTKNCKHWPGVGYIAQNLKVIAVNRAPVIIHLTLCWYHCLTDQDVLNRLRYVVVFLNIRNKSFLSQWTFPNYSTFFPRMLDDATNKRRMKGKYIYLNL